MKSHQGFGNFLIDISELEVNEKVGEGGYGVVYRGKWLGQDVAIKYGFLNSSLIKKYIFFSDYFFDS